MTGITFADGVGMLGAALIVIAYFLLQTGRLAADTLTFSMVNGLGAAGILVSLVYDFNLGAFTIEAFWLVISLYGIARVLRRRAKRDRA